MNREQQTFEKGGRCPCGSDISDAPGIGPFCKRTGHDYPCDSPETPVGFGDATPPATPPEPCGDLHALTGAVCELSHGHRENHRGPFDHGIAQWPDGVRSHLDVLKSGAPQPPAASGDVERPEDIVGHKTLSTGRVGADGFPEVRHEPLTRAEAEALRDASDRAREQRAATMPSEQTAINVMFDAWQRLKELGWREAIYCPKDGTVFDAIEAGSAGIHECSYHGEWPTGHWFIHADGDLWPSRPILFRAGDRPTPGGTK